MTKTDQQQTICASLSKYVLYVEIELLVDIMELFHVKGARDFSNDQFGNSWGTSVGAIRTAKLPNTTEIGVSTVGYRNALHVA